LADYPALELGIPLTPDPSVLVELLHACLDDFAPLAIQDTANGWLVFFRSVHSRDDAAATLRRAFHDSLTEVSPIDVADERWAERTQARLTAVRVDGIVVAPPWAIPPADRDMHVVVIHPSMGFGTGHHATTRLCLRLLQRIRVEGATAIDVGTGSGVLAIAAWKLGAARVLAVDCDPDALDNARENIASNGAAGAIELLNVDVSGLTCSPAALVLANLTSGVLQRHARELCAAVAGEGHLLVSGFAPGELRAVERAFDMEPAETISEAEWCAARFTRPTGT
jgi:ribosomal protein L11 methyltransferase